jgi:riboflavin transporter FmnP
VNTSKMARIGILGGIAFVLMLIEFPLPFFPEFLQYDTSEIPVLLGTFSLGPWVGVLIQLIKNLLYLLLSGRGNPVGVMGNFLAGSFMVLPAGFIYQHYRSKNGAICALIVGSVTMGLAMIPLNLLILFPLYGVHMEAGQIWPMMLGLVLPFNVIKGFMSSTATFLLYKKVRGFLHVDLAPALINVPEERKP